MNIDLFWILLCVTAMTLIIGYWRRVPFACFIGWGFLFLISMSFLTAGLDYKVGENTTSIVVGNTTSMTMAYTYTNYDSHLFAWMLSILSALGFVSVFFSEEVWR